MHNYVVLRALVSHEKEPMLYVQCDVRNLALLFFPKRIQYSLKKKKTSCIDGNELQNIFFLYFP